MSTLRMKAWKADKGGLYSVCLSSEVIPSTLKPNEVLVKVCAASVNQLDILLLDSSFYDTALDMMSVLSDFGDVLKRPSFPVTCGRDFVGEVVQVGHAVSNVQVNDKVWGVVMPQNQGSHAEYVVTSDFLVSQKPENISDIKAASIPYIGMTAWSTAVLIGNLIPNECKGLRIGILGANGGVGTFLTQMLSLWGAEVSAICWKDTFELVKNCGASEVFDAEDPETFSILSSDPKFHLVIDASGESGDQWTETIDLSISRSPRLITIKNPLSVNIDENFALQGTTKSLSELMKSNSILLPCGTYIKWSFFFPTKEALQCIGNLVKEEKIRPIIDKVFKMEDLLKAYEHVKFGRKRGKTVIDFAS